MHPKKDFITLGIVLVLAFLHGLIYILIIPPWQHYDEPNHFEYVWLVANRDGLPQPGDSDPGLSRKVLKSMQVHGFFRHLGTKPDLSLPDEVISIGGYSQLDEPPLYYLIASLPLRLMPTANVAAQLYAARWVSLALFLMALVAAWGATREVTSPGSPLRWMVPASMALLPGFADVMTAVNNDVAAVAAFSFFLWGSLRLLKQGPSVFWLLVTAISVALCVFTKSTAYIALPLFVLVLMFAVLRNNWRRLAWGLVAAGILVGLVFILSWGDAAWWYRSSSQLVPSRVSSPDAIVGEYVFQLETQAEVSPSWLIPFFQPIPIETGRGLQSKTVTLGAWMWSSQPLEVRTPILGAYQQAYSEIVSVSETPSFYAFSATLGENTSRVWVTLAPLKPSASPGAIVYYDGLVLVEGERPLHQEPTFNQPSGATGEWGGAPFTNLIRNASAESAGLRVSPQVDMLGSKILPDGSRPSLILTSITDLQGAGWFYYLSSLELIRTFWAKFGWGHVPLLGHRPYRPLGIITLVGIVGGVWAIVRRRKTIPMDVLVLLGLALLGAWGATLIRGAIYLAYSHLYIPVARYALPAILPTLLVLNLGWLEVFRLVKGLRLWSSEKWMQFVPKAFLVIYFLFFLGLGVYAVISITRFYEKVY